ncbi:MAG: hypothetical protein COA94_01610 [Rickettsiales bacterium]|nr:MAG: hypothetical protein COA94_01610 [Rickettsiales bacterium]
MLLLMVVFALLQVGLVWAVIASKRKVDTKNMQLIQFYLDTKFLCKGLIDSLKFPESLTFCNRFTSELKEYFNLEEIIVIDSVDMPANNANTVLKDRVIEFIEKNMDHIARGLHDFKFTTFILELDGKEYVLHISRILSKGEGDGFIICIELAPSLLSKNEIATLETCINILRTRLVYE